MGHVGADHRASPDCGALHLCHHHLDCCFARGQHHGSQLHQASSQASALQAGYDDPDSTQPGYCPSLEQLKAMLERSGSSSLTVVHRSRPPPPPPPPRQPTTRLTGWPCQVLRARHPLITFLQKQCSWWAASCVHSSCIECLVATMIDHCPCDDMELVRIGRFSW